MAKHQRIGNFILLEKLAKGGMAEVFLAKHAEDIGLTKFFAIKKIGTHFSKDTDFIEMFKNEAKIALSLSHRNIVPIYEFGVDGPHPFYTMQFIDGQSLSTILKKGMRTGRPLSIPLGVFIAKEIAAGLDAAHNCVDVHTGKKLNIIHRDISPHNIVISYFGEVKIIDFGIAKSSFQNEKTRTGIVKGKVGYLSPEQIEGIETVDGRTDIFSLGIVLWEMLTGHRLFLKSKEEESIKKILSGQIPDIRKYNPNVPQELIDITCKCLKKDRENRYQNAIDLFKELSQLMNKNYPDFFPEELGYHLKMLFGKEEKAVRKKLIEYSNLNIEKEQTFTNASVEGKTVVFGGVFRDQSKISRAPKQLRKMSNFVDQPLSTPVFDEKDLVLDLAAAKMSSISKPLIEEPALPSMQENELDENTQEKEVEFGAESPQLKTSIDESAQELIEKSSEKKSDLPSEKILDEPTTAPLRFDQSTEFDTENYIVETQSSIRPIPPKMNFPELPIAMRSLIQENLLTSVAIFSMLGAILLHWIFTSLASPNDEHIQSLRETASSKKEFISEPREKNKDSALNN